jgi:acetyl-CoA carboxylase biotin carboxyl carrier protein
MSKFKIDDDLVRNLAALLDETRLTEIEYEETGRRIRVARQPAPAAGAAAIPVVHSEAVAGRGVVEPSHPGAVTSPMVGTVYLSSEPGTAPFAAVGSEVTEGDTLLLIEAMKTFNPIRAPRAGRITQIFVADGSPVEYGEVLLILE